jgi:phosphopantothenoylcysteine decarboxylase/phosphopantothenate--cysteine ligase
MIMRDFEGKKILIGISGGIAAYKSAYLVRELIRLGACVRVVMTAAATQFITPMTLQALSGHPVRVDLFDGEAEHAMGHIELARWADYWVVAPASANCLAKMAHGVADDLLSTLALVIDGPVLVCPGMNRSMWSHPATQANVSVLKQRGVIVVGPAEGAQACGEYGLGRLVEVEHIIHALRLCTVNQRLQNQRVMITAGPTREAIDPVRYLSNHSSGKMGYALAEAALMAGAQVTLISGPTALAPPPGVQMIFVNTAAEMHDAVMEHLTPGVIFIGAAAVSDYHVETPALNKLKKRENLTLSLKLIPNIDILAAVAARKQALFVVGFAAETTDLLVHAREKLQKKNLDMVVANRVGPGLGFETDDNAVTVLTATTTRALTQQHKVRLAAELVAIIATSLQNVGQKLTEEMT